MSLETRRKRILLDLEELQEDACSCCNNNYYDESNNAKGKISEAIIALEGLYLCECSD